MLEQAHWLYRTQRGLTLRDLSDFRRRSYGVDSDSDRETLRATLLAGGWAEDGDDWLPAGEYYTGSLWPRYDRATARAAAGDPVATSQAARLLEAIAPVTLSAIAPRTGATRLLPDSQGRFAARANQAGVHCAVARDGDWLS